MVFVIVYALVGIYLALMAMGLVQKTWWAKIDSYTQSSVRLAIAVMAVGFLGLALYTGFLYQRFRAGRLPGQQPAPSGATPTPLPAPGENELPPVPDRVQGL